MTTRFAAAERSTTLRRRIRLWSIATFLFFCLFLDRPGLAGNHESAFPEPSAPTQSETEREQAALAQLAVWNIESNADFARVLDHHSDGLFTKLAAARDPQLTITHYRTLIAAYSEIVDTLYDAYSPYANSFPGWYRDQLESFGLGRLGPVKKKSARFFRKELERADMDRVIHAFHILSLNRYDLVDAYQAPTSLRKQLIKAARKDKDGRYWISLHLAERRLLRDDFEWDAYRTKNVSEFESLHMHVGMNAKTLGPRIYRVIDLPTDVNDTRLSHFHVGEARQAAVDRIRKHALLAGGREEGYRRITEELQAMRTGTFSSIRFQEILVKDLNYLYDAYGMPPNASSMIRLLDRIYKAKGQQRMMMRMALNQITGKYQMVLRARAQKRKQAVAAKPLIEVDAILKKGEAGSYAFLEKALTDEKGQRLITHLIEKNAVPRVVKRYPPESPPRAIEVALQRGYQLVGHPAALRANYFDAMALLASLDPERQIKQPPPRDAFVDLIDAFVQVTTIRDFGRGFTALQNAEMSFLVRRDANPNPELVAAFIQAAVAAIRHEGAIRTRAREDVAGARKKLEQIGGEIQRAESDIAAANSRIADANQEAARAEERANAAIAERNGAVEQINQKILDVRKVQHENEVDRSTRRPDGSAISKRELAALEQREIAARTELSDTEKRLLPFMDRKEEESTREEAEADAAAGRAAHELLIAQSAERRARAAIVHENAAFEEEIEARGREQASLERILGVLNKVVVGFDFMGIAPEVARLGQAGANLNASLAGIAVIAESAFKDELTSEMTRALEAEAQSKIPSTREFAKVAIEFGS